MLSAVCVFTFFLGTTTADWDQDVTSSPLLSPTSCLQVVVGRGQLHKDEVEELRETYRSRKRVLVRDNVMIATLGHPPMVEPQSPFPLH